MQTATFINKVSAFKASTKSTGSVSRRALVVRAQQQGPMQEIAKNAALLSLSAALFMAPAAEAKVQLTQREQEMQYQQEMLAALKARGKGDVLNSLTSSPEVKEEKKEKKAEASVIPSFSLEAEKPKAAAPAPAAPAPAAAPVVSFSNPAPAAVASGDNKGLIAAGAIGVIAVVGAAAASNNSAETEAAGGAPSSAADNGAGDVPANVREARAWIARWKSKNGKN